MVSISLTKFEHKYNTFHGRHLRITHKCLPFSSLNYLIFFVFIMYQVFSFLCDAQYSMKVVFH